MERKRRNFCHYIYEFRNFTTLDFDNMPSELGKYRVSPMLAQRYLSQVGLQIQVAFLGNVGTMIIFRLRPAPTHGQTLPYKILHE